VTVPSKRSFIAANCRAAMSPDFSMWAHAPQAVSCPALRTTASSHRQARKRRCASASLPSSLRAGCRACSPNSGG